MKTKFLRPKKPFNLLSDPVMQNFRFLLGQQDYLKLILIRNDYLKAHCKRLSLRRFKHYIYFKFLIFLTAACKRQKKSWKESFRWRRGPVIVECIKFVDVYFIYFFWKFFFFSLLNDLLSHKLYKVQLWNFYHIFLSYIHSLTQAFYN